MATGPEDLLHDGLETLTQGEKPWDEEDKFYRGEHERPFAPEGVKVEYTQLREMAVAPWLRLIVRAPTQRLRVDGFRTDSSADVDRGVWLNVWKANRLEALQRIPYVDALVHGRGVVSVGPRSARLERPHVNVESPREVTVSYVDTDPFTPEWAVKRWSVVERDGSRKTTIQYAVVYTAGAYYRYRQVGGGRWALEASGVNPLGRVPFVEFRPESDSRGRTLSMIRPLFPMQRAVDTMRFDLLLAAQFSAYRQRFITGFDPVLRDADGQILWAKKPDGTLLVDENGQPVPMTTKPGRPGVDRMMAFPGEGTKVFDLPESNLGNYVDVIKMLVQQLAAIAQVPPQYLLGDMANLSADALVAAESTLVSLVNDLKYEFGMSWSEVIRLADRAAGGDGDQLASEVVWGDGEARSFAQTADAIVKLIGVGFPREAAFEMLPGATTVKVGQWMDMMRDEMASAYATALQEGASDGGVDDAA